MLSRAIGLGAALALGTNAILLPPGVALNEYNDHDLAADTFTPAPTFPFACDDCPFAESQGDVMVWSNEAVENSLIYQFGFGEDQHRLTLNGVQLYPPSLAMEPIYIHQIPNDVSVDEYIQTNPDRKALQITRMEFIFNDAETISEEGNELLTMHLKISGLAERPIPPQVFRLFIVKDTAGRLHMGSVVKFNDPESIEAEEEEQCRSWPLLCKWRQYAADRFSSLKGSMTGAKKPCNKTHPSGPPGHGRPHHKPGHWGKPHHKGNPHHRPHPHHGAHHGFHHGHGHRHSKLHCAMRAVARVMVNIVLPILIGVAAGVATYMAGMVIGMTVAVLWAKVRGRSQRNADYDALPQYEEEDSNASAKELYLAEEIAEVEGEAPPVYQDVAEKEVVN